MSGDNSVTKDANNIKFEPQHQLSVSYVYTKIQMNIIKCVEDIQVPIFGDS